MEISYVDSDSYFEITDNLKERGVVDKKDVINIETVWLVPTKDYVYRAWYWVKE